MTHDTITRYVRDRLGSFWRALGDAKSRRHQHLIATPDRRPDARKP